MAQDHLTGKRVPCPACGNELLIAPPPSDNAPAAKLPAAKPPAANIPPIQVRCRCGKAYKAPAALRGKSLKCPACGQDVAIPVNSPPAAAPAAASAAPDPFGMGAPLGGDLFGPDPFAGAALGNDPLGGDLFAGPLAGGLQGGPLTQPLAGMPSAVAPQPMHAAYGAPQGADDGGGSNKLLIFLGIGVGVTLLGLVVGIWLINRGREPAAVATSTSQPTVPATSTPATTTPSTTTPASTSPAPPATGVANPMGASPSPAGPMASEAPMTVGPMTPGGSDPAANPGGIVGTAPASASPGGTPAGVSPMGVGSLPMGPIPAGPMGVGGSGQGAVGPGLPGNPGSNPAGGANSGATKGPGDADPPASRPAGKVLGTGLVPWNSSGKLVGTRIVGEGDNLQAHYSWMTQILPFIGRDDEFKKFDFSKPRYDKVNLQNGAIVIPEFLNPGDDRIRWKGFPHGGYALTHFVGMSGIEDSRNVVAAKLPRSDPRAGVFGYDAIATPAEITDGTSNTIMVLGGGELANPWVMGGGATIRGARQPYFDKITGFGSKGTSGVLVMMADGSVREISSNVDPAVFRALCTIHGADTVDLEKSAPLHQVK